MLAKVLVVEVLLCLTFVCIGGLAAEKDNCAIGFAELEADAAYSAAYNKMQQKASECSNCVVTDTKDGINSATIINWDEGDARDACIDLNAKWCSFQVTMEIKGNDSEVFKGNNVGFQCFPSICTSSIASDILENYDGYRAEEIKTCLANKDECAFNFTACDITFSSGEFTEEVEEELEEEESDDDEESEEAGTNTGSDATIVIPSAALLLSLCSLFIV